MEINATETKQLKVESSRNRALQLVAKIIYEKGGMKEEVVEARPHRTGFGGRVFLKAGLKGSIKDCFTYHIKVRAWMPK